MGFQHLWAEDEGFELLFSCNYLIFVTFYSKNPIFISNYTIEGDYKLVMEQTHAGEGHDHTLPVALFDDQIIAD